MKNIILMLFTLLSVTSYANSDCPALGQSESSALSNSGFSIDSCQFMGNDSAAFGFINDLPKSNGGIVEYTVYLCKKDGALFKVSVTWLNQIGAMLPQCDTDDGRVIFKSESINF